MYAQVRHPWRTRPVRVIPKGLTCAAGLQHSAPGSSQPFVQLPLSIQRSQARSKYIHVCSGAPSVAHKACTRYTEKPNLRCWLPALRSTLFIWHFRYNARRHAASTSMYAQVRHHGAQGLYALYRKANLRCWLPAPSSQLPAPSSQLSALGSRLPAPSSQLPAPNSQPSIFQTIIHPKLNSLTQVLLFSYNQVQLSFKVPVRKL